jgi:hypothetical protein
MNGGRLRAYPAKWLVDSAQAGAVPPGSEYEEHPRGRVAYETRTQQYSLLSSSKRDKEETGHSGNIETNVGPMSAAFLFADLAG